VNEKSVCVGGWVGGWVNWCGWVWVGGCKRGNMGEVSEKRMCADRWVGGCVHWCG